MIEILFSDSAAGSLKQAQRFGRGTFRPPAMGLIALQSDGQPVSEADLKKLEQQEIKRLRLAWEKAVPLNGSSSDVFSFSLAHSIGDISEDGVGAARLDALHLLFWAFPERAGSSVAEQFFHQAVQNLEIVKKRAKAGEPVRIWYCDQPDEQCGFHWFLAQLFRWQSRAAVFTVCLPRWDTEGQTVITHTGWGEVSPEDWSRYVPLQQELPPPLLSAAAARWKELQQENACLRAVINGRLHSVPEDFYDPFLYREIQAQEEEFQEARLIGSVIGKYQLGVSDGWLARRIEKMIEKGELTAVTSPPPDGPVYHRFLKKTE